MTVSRLPLLAGGLILLLSCCAQEPEEQQAEAAAPASQGDEQTSEAWSSDPYPLPDCPVSGEALGSLGDVVVLQRPGREVRLCCASCVETYEADPAAFDATIDAAIVALQRPDYPMETCLISGEVIGRSATMVPHDQVLGNRLYRLCCDACVGALKKDLPRYRAQLKAAAD